MILDPINDRECLDQLTTIARELFKTTLIWTIAKRLGTREAIIEWIQSLPQDDDDGSEHVRYIQCDVPQRVRLLPDTPNCVERSLEALMLLEVVDPSTPRALATVDKPLRHTGLVEKRAGRWIAVDLFPRRNAARNFDFSSFGKDALQGVHNYVGKPILKFYLGESGGKVADAIGEQEDQWIGRDKKKPTEKKDAPPPGGTQRAGEQPKQPQQQPKPQQREQPAAPKAQPASRFDFARVIGAGANQEHTAPVGAGGKDGEKEKGPSDSRAAVDGAASSAGSTVEAAEGNHRDPHDARAQAQRFWRSLGW